MSRDSVQHVPMRHDRRAEPPAAPSRRLRGEGWGEGASPPALSRQSELAERPPRPDPLHSPSKTGVNALMASGEREKALE